MQPRVEQWNASTVALGFKDRETERLAAEVAALTGETKTEAARRALRERKRRLEREASREAAGGA